MCVRIYYRKQQEQAEVVKCFATTSEAEIPGEIGGCKFTAIGAYGFSEGGDDAWRQEAYVQTPGQIPESEVFRQEFRPLYGSAVTAVKLPDTIKEIRDYAFYRCFGLKRLSLTDQTERIGGGAFTGCRVKEIEVDCYSGVSSCLKDIVGEIRHAVFVTLRYHKTTSGMTETAKLVFPEYYEEAVENTPARILETHYHGSGCHYRQCFYNRELDYRKYDALFKTAVAQEQETVVIALAAGRLRYPYRLSAAAKEQYESYVRQKWANAAIWFIEREDQAGLMWLLETGLATAGEMDAVIEYAARHQRTEILGRFMHEKQSRFQVQKKTFEL